MFKVVRNLYRHEGLQACVMLALVPAWDAARGNSEVWADRRDPVIGTWAAAANDSQDQMAHTNVGPHRGRGTLFALGLPR